MRQFKEGRLARRYSCFVWLLLCGWGCLLLCELLPVQAEEAALSLTSRVQAHIEYLASEEMGGRRAQKAQQAGEYVAEQLKGLGLLPAFAEDSYFQAIPGPPDEAGQGTVQGRNVAAVLPGSDTALKDEYILIAAHHDHLGRNRRGIFYGADDNATGVAMILEVARLLQESEKTCKRSVLIVSFDLEEHLLFGSRWFVAHPPMPLEQIKCVIVADMLGRSLGDLPLEAVFLFGSERGTGLREQCQRLPFAENCRPVFLNAEFVGTRSDYAPFRDRQIPFVFVSTGQSRDYHTIRDTAEQINFSQVAGITRALARLMSELANAAETPEWIDEPPPARDEVAAIQNIVAQIEAQADNWQLSPLQRLFVQQARQQTRQILERDQFTAEDRKRLTRTTQLLLFSVF